MAGLLLAGSQQVQEIVYQPPDTGSLAYQIADAAWPLSVLFMLVVGALAINAKTIKGWPRFTPLFCGLALPLFIFTNAAIGKEAATLAFGIYTMAAWAFFGYGIWKGEEHAGNINLKSSVPIT